MVFSYICAIIIFLMYPFHILPLPPLASPFLVQIAFPYSVIIPHVFCYLLKGYVFESNFIYF